MEKQAKKIKSVSDQELAAITGGAGGDDAYRTEKCFICGEDRSGSDWTLNDWKKEHTQKTGHNSYVSYDQ